MKGDYILNIMYESFNRELPSKSRAFLLGNREFSEDYLLRIFLYDLKAARNEKFGDQIVEEETECLVGKDYAVITWEINGEKYNRYYEIIELSKRPDIPKLNKIVSSFPQVQISNSND